MAHPEVEEWLRTAPGLHLNPDRQYGNQCVDLADAFAEAIFGVPWQTCLGGVVGAKQLLDAAPDKYWIRINNDPSDPNLLPPRGALVVTGGDASNPWGHVYAVLKADKNGCDALQQDGFAAPLQFVNGAWYSAKPAHTARLPWAGPGIGTTLGWLIPRENMIKDTGAAKRLGLEPVALQPYQRTTGDNVKVGYRKAPAATAELINWLEPDRIYDFKGYVIRGKETWFVGRYSGGFSIATGFTDPSTKGLTNLTETLFPTPKPTPTAPEANVRVTGADGVNRRKGADKNAELIDTFGAGLEITVGGYVIGTDPYGKDNTVWFVGGISGGYMHSSGFTSQSITGLKKLELPTVVPGTPATPVAPAYDFVLDFDWLEKIPAHLTNVELGRAPKKDGPTVIHQMGTPGRDTLGSTINEFKRKDAFKSTHFCTEGERGVQMVSLKDRAYHSGPTGNDYVGIETDPHQTPETIATTRRILAGLKAKGYKSALIRHKEIPGQATACGTLIDLAKYQITDPLPLPPVVEPPIVVPPAPDVPEGVEGDVLDDFAGWLVDSFRNREQQ